MFSYNLKDPVQFSLNIKMAGVTERFTTADISIANSEFYTEKSIILKDVTNSK